MDFDWKWSLVIVVSFLLNGKTLDAQVDDLYCGPFCLNDETACECTVTGKVLTWKIDPPNGLDGEKSLQPEDLNMCKPVTGFPAFCVRLTDISNGTLTATLRFNITNHDYQDYSIQCATGNNSTTLAINIESAPGEVENLTMFNVTSTSVWFTFNPPMNSGCIAYYKIVTDANGTTNTTDSVVEITKPQSDNSSNTTYMITVSAVDIAGTEGKTYTMCFMFAMDDPQYCPFTRPPPTGTSSTTVSPSPGSGGSKIMGSLCLTVLVAFLFLIAAFLLTR